MRPGGLWCCASSLRCACLAPSGYRSLTPTRPGGRCALRLQPGCSRARAIFARESGLCRLATSSLRCARPLGVICGAHPRHCGCCVRELYMGWIDSLFPPGLNCMARPHCCAGFRGIKPFVSSGQARQSLSIYSTTRTSPGLQSLRCAACHQTLCGLATHHDLYGEKLSESIHSQPCKGATTMNAANKESGSGTKTAKALRKVAPIKNKGVTSPPLKPMPKIKAVGVNFNRKTSPV